MSPAEIQWSAPGELDELRAGDLRCEIPALRDVDVVVAGAVEDERRDPDRRQDVPDVDVRVHAQEGRGRPGARAAPEVLLEVPHELLVADAAGRVVLDVLRPKVTPVPLDVRRGLLAVLGRRRPGIVVVRVAALREAAERDQRGRPLGIGRGEEHAHVPALGVPEERGPLRADRLEHGADVVHPLLEGRAARR